MLTLLVKYTNN